MGFQNVLVLIAVIIAFKEAEDGLRLQEALGHASTRFLCTGAYVI
ncbi:MAG: hypothetical protein RMK50_00205 [Nitrososphaerota archaeon]|nr:hypothetical protein [Candidatus Bathyarchaeota archaeon]MDW8193237.1 hypothetical protein [Nitrososphaerota archaeon]